MQFEHFDIVGSNTLGERFQTATNLLLYVCSLLT